MDVESELLYSILVYGSLTEVKYKWGDFDLRAFTVLGGGGGVFAAFVCHTLRAYCFCQCFQQTIKAHRHLASM